MRRTVLLLTAIAAALVLGSGVAHAATLVGTNRADNLQGTSNSDKIYGLNGGDTLNGRGGNDEISGDAGNDGIVGGASTTSGQNELYGGSGADYISADMPAAYDEVYGGSGDDTIFADDGRYDYVNCGRYSSPGSFVLDNDIVYVDSTDEVVGCENVF